MMAEALVAIAFLDWLLAVAAIVLGRNLTRSVMIGYAFVGCLCIVLLVAGAGFLAVIVGIGSAIGLASIQAIGWMLVDVDRDHLAPTDASTWIARALAFAMLGAGLVLLALEIGPELDTGHVFAPAESALLGRALFGPLGGAAVLLGLAIAAALLATMLLLRDDEEGS
jgi:hypothetical protein